MNLIRCDWDENKSKAKKKSVGIGFDEIKEFNKYEKNVSAQYIGVPPLTLTLSPGGEGIN